MEIATPAGIIAGFVAIIVAMIMEGGQPASLVSSPSALILIFVGTFGVGLASNKLSDLGGILKSGLKIWLPGKKLDEAAAVEQLVQFADTARREGLLALEEKVKTVEDPFLKRGLELVIDGSDPEAVEETLETELEAMSARHKVNAKFYADLGGFAPTIGILGTVMGLIHVLENLNHPETLGPLISSAFLATLWGVMSANVIFLPMSNKLKRNSQAEIAYKSMILSGVLSIQAGASPRALGERLTSHLAPKERAGLAAKKKAA